MTRTRDHHRPLVSRIQIASAKQGETEILTGGTLTRLATRDSDGAHVLVTNLHVMSGSHRVTPSGNEILYQGDFRGEGGHLVPGNRVATHPSWDPDEDPDNPTYVPDRALMVGKCLTIVGSATSATSPQVIDVLVDIAA